MTAIEVTGGKAKLDEDCKVDVLARYGISQFLLDTLKENGYHDIKSTIGASKRDLKSETGFSGAEVDRVKAARGRFMLDGPLPLNEQRVHQWRDARALELLEHFGIDRAQTLQLRASGYLHFCQVIETPTQGIARRTGLCIDEVMTIKQAIINAADYQPFRFTSLPFELRSKICKLALPDQVHRPHIRVGEKKDSVKIRKPAGFPLARTCRQIRNEALAAYFSTCTLSIRVSKHGDVSNYEWVHDQDEMAISCIRSFRFTHKSNVDHGTFPHYTALVVDLLSGMVGVERDEEGCDKCREARVVVNVAEKLQTVLDEILPVRGDRKRLNKEVLSEMIGVATELCVAATEMDGLLAAKRLDCAAEAT